MEDRNKLILHKLQPRPKLCAAQASPGSPAGKEVRSRAPFGIAIYSSLPVGFKAQIVEIQLQKHFDYQIQKLKHGQACGHFHTREEAGNTPTYVQGHSHK